MIAEHTWGADVKTHLRNWDKYDLDSFTAARTQPEFLFTEQSWRELDDNIDKAVALLPDPLREEAREALKLVGEVDRRPSRATTAIGSWTPQGAMPSKQRG